jgi:hypothetical protein
VPQQPFLFIVRISVGRTAAPAHQTQYRRDYHFSGILTRILHCGHFPILPANPFGTLNLLPHEQVK